MDSLTRFTDRARGSLDMSIREALAMGHNYVGPEHILLGLLRDHEALPYRALENLGVDPLAIRNEVVRLLSGGGQDTVPPSKLEIEEDGLMFEWTGDSTKIMIWARNQSELVGELEPTHHGWTPPFNDDGLTARARIFLQSRAGTFLAGFYA